ncbi:hypothetical protein [Phaeobacter phage MD18]|nr:hypothetical protein [Phaeobacter phage MD18]
MWDIPRTKAMLKFIEKEGPGGTGRITGLSIEADGVFIYTDSTQWCDDAGSGTFRGDSETAAIKVFKERGGPAPGSDWELAQKLIDGTVTPKEVDEIADRLKGLIQHL